MDGEGDAAVLTPKVLRRGDDGFVDDGIDDEAARTRWTKGAAKMDEADAEAAVCWARNKRRTVVIIYPSICFPFHLTMKGGQRAGD